MIYDLTAFTDDFFKRNNITREQIQQLLASMESDESLQSLDFGSGKNLTINDNSVSFDES